MPQQIQLNASAIGGLIQTLFSGNIRVPSSGLITVSTLDAPSLLAAGANYVGTPSRTQNILAPAAAAVGTVVASTTLANGSLTIAASPDVGRLCSVRVDTGTAAITAGNIAFTYTANDGTQTIDNFSPVAIGTTILSTNTSKGVLHAVSAVVTGLATGGTTCKVQIDTLAGLALQVDPGFAGFVLDKLTVDGADIGTVSVASTAACVTPSTAPNATHNYAAWYNYIAPTS